jgi:type II secretory ATPase GspE/PulE/Tfp pilus assembly ATPase PilB-like protein
MTSPGPEGQHAPVVKLVNTLLAEAVKMGASDIHIEPYEKNLRVRYRVDGVLQEVMEPPVKLRNAIISRLKIMADLDIAERRMPAGRPHQAQDARPRRSTCASRRCPASSARRS